MTVYFKTKDGLSLIKLGKILTIGGTKKDSLLTGDTGSSIILLAKYANKEEAQKTLDEIINKITHPTAKEIQSDTMYIQLQEE